MKTTAVILIILAVLLGSFGYWGMYTKAGHVQYDEMAGMIPWFAQILALFFFTVSIFLFAVTLVKNRKKSSH